MKRVEAAGNVFGRYSRLFISLSLASYIYSLDSSTTSSYLSFAASSFGEHSLISSVQVAQSVIGECKQSNSTCVLSLNRSPALSPLLPAALHPLCLDIITCIRTRPIGHTFDWQSLWGSLSLPRWLTFPREHTPISVFVRILVSTSIYINSLVFSSDLLCHWVYRHSKCSGSRHGGWRHCGLCRVRPILVFLSHGHFD